MANDAATETVRLEHLVPYFQPIMDVRHNRVWCYESLARLVYPSDHIFLPSQFLHLIERENNVSHFTETIFARSASYFRNINVAWNINISEHDLISPGLLSMITAYLKNYPNPRRVGVELTSHTALAHPELFGEFTDACQKTGLRVFIDHFGGQPDSDIGLMTLPIHGIKLTGALIADMRENPQSRDFIKQVQQQAVGKNLAIVAEHVEDEATLSAVKNLDLRLAQGFYFSRPQPAAADIKPATQSK